MYVTFKLSRIDAADLRMSRAANTHLECVLEVIDEHGSSLVPPDAGLEDVELSTYFFVSVAEADTGRRLASALLDCKGVEAAYLNEEP